MTPQASIIIVTYGQRALTEQCLRSLERCLGDKLGREFELVLVDNASPDDTPQLLESWSDRAVVQLLRENRNFAGGCNAGAAAAHGEVLVFLNNDTEVLAGSLETIVEQALEPRVSVAGCRLLFPDGTLQHAGVAFVHGSALGGAAMGQHVFHRQSPELPGSRGIYELDCVTAACMAVRAATFRAVGGFDEGFVNGLEDVDLCLRIRVEGERIVYRGDATVIHYEGASRGQGAQLWATPERMQAMRSNDLRFVGRWAQHLDQDDELAAALWDAALEDQAPQRWETAGEVVVAGQPGGIGPGGDEARAFVAALAATGRRPVAADEPHPNVIPRLSGELAATVDAARHRLPRPGAPWILIPSGERDRLIVDVPTIVRLGRPRTATPIHDTTHVWASSPALADELINGGMRAYQVHVVPPPVMPTPVGRGGGGVLAVLPAHSPRCARAVLDALQRLPASIPVRLIPTVAVRGLADEVTSALATAELLSPVSDENCFTALAANADVVLSVGDDDPFERRALLAAATGTAALTGRAHGPAAAVLGPDCYAADRMGEAVLERLEQADAEVSAVPAVRAARAARVADACGPERVAQALGEADQQRAGLVATAT
jgi:GT2 family glycosyltransferase